MSPWGGGKHRAGKKEVKCKREVRKANISWLGPLKKMHLVATRSLGVSPRPGRVSWQGRSRASNWQLLLDLPPFLVKVYPLSVPSLSGWLLWAPLRSCWADRGSCNSSGWPWCRWMVETGPEQVRAKTAAATQVSKRSGRCRARPGWIAREGVELGQRRRCINWVQSTNLLSWFWTCSGPRWSVQSDDCNFGEHWY